VTVKELIAALQQFPESDGVCIEVTELHAAEIIEGDGECFFDLDSVSPECRNGNAVKLTLL
jgi:hypothetical protein